MKIPATEDHRRILALDHRSIDGAARTRMPDESIIGLDRGLAGQSAPSWLALLALGCGLLGSPPPLLALDPAKSVFQFNVQNWTRQDGLSAGKVNTVAQTADGYIWLGTSEGLVRFDGIDFKGIPADFPGARGREVRAIVPSRDGGLLLTINNGGFASYFEGKFSLIADSHWPNERMTGKTILEARNGAVWTGSNIGVGRWVKGNPGEGWFTETFPRRVFTLCEDPAGRTWAGSDDGLFYVADGIRTEIDSASGDSGAFLSLASDPAGNIWVGMARELRCYNAQGKRIETPPLSTGINALLVDSHGILWIGTSLMGLGRYHNGEFTFLKAVDGLGSDYVTSLFEDAEGSLWVGTRDGLSQLTDLKFPLVTDKEGIVPGPAHTVSASRQGGLWITTSSGVSYFDGKTARNYTKGQILSDNNVKLGFETKNGDVYLANDLKTIDVLSGDKLAARYASESFAEALGEDAESVLVGLGTTLWRARDGKLQPYAFAGDQEPDFGWFDHLTVARDGTIWIPSYRGIFRIKDGHFKQWPIGSEGSTDRMHYLFEDVDGSIWAGLSTGMARIKNDRLQKISAKDGLYDDMVYAIVPDDHGYFWIDSGRGIFRVSRQQLNDFADGKLSRVQCEAFDGLESVKSTDHIDQEYSGCKTLDGRIWFPNARGVVMIDPGHFCTNRNPPPVHVNEIRVNGVASAVRNDFVLQPGDERVEIFFSALSYISPLKVQVQYQLQGLDRTWIDAGGRRSAVYNRLAPGRYTFRVKARNADGVWSVADAELELEQLPQFYQTGWFMALTGFAGVMALVGAYSWKVRRIKVVQKRLQSDNDLLESKVGKRTVELAYERDLLQILLDRLPDTIYFKDLQSRFARVSRSKAERSLNILRAGYRRSHPNDGPEKMPAHLTDIAHLTVWLIGKTDADVYDAERARLAHEEEQEIIRTGQPVVAQLEYATMPDGQAIWQVVTKMPWHNRDGDIIGTFGTSHDITPIKQAEAKLADTHKQLLVTSRQAGMAEVATSVLHNVGNVLNSVNVSTTLARETLRASEVTTLGRACDLLRSHVADMDAFLTTDSKGRQLPGLVIQLADRLANEHRALSSEIEHLSKNVEHIKSIVAMQQNYATVSGIQEKVHLVDLLRDVLQMHSVSFVRHGIEVIREYEDLPEMILDRHKVVQILVNLVANSQQAIDGTKRRSGRIKVGLQMAGDDCVRVSISDNGIGIPAENLTRIFSHGFTTRHDGHGFGLHSGALAAREMGGSLTVHSDGPGLGATFTLELPIGTAESLK